MARRRAGARGSEERPLLRGLELEVMHVVWELGECTSGDVIAAFRSKRELAPSTIRNVLANLRAKGWVKPIPAIGRGFRLQPTTPRDSAARRSLKSLLTSWFGGSTQQAIAYLLDDEEISQADLEQIGRLLKARRRAGGSP
jgi:predicted transcriptional regulator